MTIYEPPRRMTANEALRNGHRACATPPATPAPRARTHELYAEQLARHFFNGAPASHQAAGLAALFRLRPDLGTANDQDHGRHMLLWPNDPHYFLSVCQLLKAFDIGQ